MDFYNFDTSGGFAENSATGALSVASSQEKDF
jgi:hypothetical protein